MGKKFPVGSKWKSLLITALLNMAATLLSFFVQHLGFSEVNIVVIYILSVLVIALFTKGYAYGVATSIVSMLSFNFFFSDPVFSFNVYDTAYIFTFVVMLAASLITSTLTSRLLNTTQQANEKERQAQVLYAVTSALSKSSGMEDVAGVAVKFVANYLDAKADCILVQREGEAAICLTSSPEQISISRTTVLKKQVGELTEGRYVIPIKAEGQIVCVFCVPQQVEKDEAVVLLDSIVMQVGIAMERELLTKEKEAAKNEAERERFKSNLLRAISHDLRTPLTTISGSIEMLRSKLEDEEAIALAQSIYEDTEWLTRLVENILNLTRIQEGRVEVKVQPEAVEEVVAAAIQRAGKYAPGKTIVAKVPDEVLFVPMDARLIQQVLINLIDNATKHTGADGIIKVTVERKGGRAWFSVADNGTGVCHEDLPRLFDIFFTTSGGDSRRGVGLGLAISKAIIRYHHGEIFAENNYGCGATFKFYLNI